MPTRTISIRLFDIQWDMESDGGEPPELPTEVIVEVDVFPGENQDSILEKAIDRASDLHGFCIFGSKSEKLLH